MNDSQPPPALTALERSESSRFSLLSLWGAVRKNWIIVAVLTIATSLAVVFYTLGQTKIFQAQATVLFDPQPPRPLGNQVQTVVDTGGQYWNNKEYYNSQLWVLQSQRIAVAVVKQLALHRDNAFLTNSAPGAPQPAVEVTVEEAAVELTNRLTVEPVRDSRLARVKYRDADPARGQRITATLVDTFVQTNLDDMMESSTMAADWLRGQVGTLKTDLETSEMALHTYKEHKNILSVSMDDQSNMLREEMKQLNAALTEVRTRREHLAARKAELMKVDPNDPSNVPVSELLGSPTLQTQREAYVDAVRNRNALIGTGKGANHPEMRAAEARASVTRTALLEEIRNIRGAMEREYSAATSEVRGLTSLYEAANKRALDVNLLEIEYNRLRRSKETNEKLFSIVIERSKESDLTRMLRINNIRVVERPSQPKDPVAPNVPMNLALGLLSGLILGLGTAIGREQLDRSIKTPGDVEHELGLTFLGLLPAVNEKRPGPTYGRRRRQGPPEPDGATRPELIVHEHPTSGIAESARAIRTNIMFMSPDNPFRTLLVTSAGPSEGKTTVASCIAIAMAQAGKRVVLLDCDMRRPRIHRLFGRANEVGVTTLLLDLTSLEEALVDTGIPNLSVVMTGPIPPNPAELLHSEAFEKLLRLLRERFDRVIIDSPPIVPVTDGAVLSTKVDGTVLVVRAFKTSLDMAGRGVRALRDVGGRTVGCVLNAVDLERRDYGYYQYYYYRKEGYAADQPPVQPRDPDQPAPLA